MRNLFAKQIGLRLEIDTAIFDQELEEDEKWDECSEWKM